MVVLSSDIEKELWRNAALKALGNVDDVTAEQHQDAIKFASMVADGVVLSYRKRCKKDERTKE
jgi:hypothetical protein